MRIWSLHPKYLDSRGLVALWRESLLARKVLEGKTRGYKNHPQLNRFKKEKYPLDCINQYLASVYNESDARGYTFNKRKISWDFKPQVLPVTEGQLRYEREHLLKKLKVRDRDRYNRLHFLEKFEPNPLFRIVEGEIEDWEIM